MAGNTMPVSFLDLQLAFGFASSGGMGENEAYLDPQSGGIYSHSEFGDNDEKLPDEIDDEKYIVKPDKGELNLGKPLVLNFAREFLPDDYDEVYHIFSQRDTPEPTAPAPKSGERRCTLARTPSSRSPLAQQALGKGALYSASPQRPIGKREQTTSRSTSTTDAFPISAARPAAAPL
jgi:hypothetical protein